MPVEALPKRWPVSLLAAVRVLICLWITQFIGFALTSGAAPASVSVPAYRVDRILIQPKAGFSPAALANFHAALNVAGSEPFSELGSRR